MIDLSIVLSVRNEEKFLGKCLESIKDIAGEIIVFDEKSTDKTPEIARKYKAKLFSVNHEENFHITKQKAIEKATKKWILQLDADEVVSLELKKEITQIIKSDPPENGFWIPRSNFCLGRFLKKGGTYPDYTLRLYRNGEGKLPCKSVHEQAEVEGKVGFLKNDLLHFADESFERYISRWNRYTDLQAKGVKGGFITNIFIKPLFDSLQGFITIYFRHLGFLDGLPGFIWALFSALTIPISYFKSKER